MNNQANPPRIDPTVGRVLYYFERQTQSRNGQTGVFLRGPLAAIVCAVLSPRVVNLSVHNESGTTYPVQGVYLVQPGEMPPDIPSYAQWMPFQVGQAAKAGAEDAISKRYEMQDARAGADMGHPDTDRTEACESLSGVGMLKRIDERAARGLCGNEGRIPADPRND